ncbi:hypothetical protein JW916_14325 [Candidatus Sumerlaeota bacterium]|nr:hypothetical protein [Candidatus Sumerlaeota bacterium]
MAEERLTAARALAAVATGLAGAVGIWWAIPYVNYVMRVTDLVNGYLPQAGLIGILLLAIVLNPVLRLLNPRWMFSSRQLALAAAVMLIACVIGGQGLMAWLPHVLGYVPFDVSSNGQLAEAYAQMDLPSFLFPDPIGLGKSTDVTARFVHELLPGESIPWGAWGPPLLGWAPLLLGCWLMTIGMAAIVYPQWRRNERLAFPLLETYRSLIAPPGPGRLFPPLFRSGLFWGSAGAVLLLFILQGFEYYYPDRIPRIPLAWNLRGLFTEGFLGSLPYQMVEGRLLFIMIGVTFFMPTRISFSIWFFAFAYGLHEAIVKSYMPPYYKSVVTDHRMGAMLAMTAAILWLGRAHWFRVLRCSFTRARSEEDRRDRTAGLAFLSGCAIMIGWFTYVGHVPILWSVFFTAFGFMISLLIARIVCETGMPFVRLDCAYQISLVKLAPIGWLGYNTLYFAIVTAILFPVSSILSPAAMATQAMALDEKASPRYRSRLVPVLIGCLVVGLVVCGAASLTATYHHSMTLDGREHPISNWGTGVFNNAHTDIQAWMHGRVDLPLYNQKAHIAFGVGLAGLLEWLSLRIPRWPLHPIGLLMANVWWSKRAWHSIFIGWLLKALILRYGGARVYRSARPVFLGMIMGTVFASVFWTLHSVAMVLLGRPYLTGVMDARF